MATVDVDLSEGISFTEDPDSGRIRYVLPYHVKDLNPGTTAELIAEALGLVPARLAAGPIANTFVTNREPQPLPPLDCIVLVNFSSPKPGDRVGDPPRIAISTSLDQGETDFDAENRALPFNQRTPLEVKYDASSGGAPGGSAKSFWPRLPVLLPRSVISFTRRISYLPAEESRTYVGKTNANTFFGCPPESLIVLEIVGDSEDGGLTYSERISLGYDPDDLWRQGARYIDPGTGQPPVLTQAQVAAENGIKFVKVQGQIDFTGMGITLP